MCRPAEATPRRKRTCGQKRPFSRLRRDENGRSQTIKCVAPLEMPLGRHCVGFVAMTPEKGDSVVRARRAAHPGLEDWDRVNNPAI
jgi:hypothetical protein